MAHKLNLTLQHPLRILDTLKKVKKIVTYYRASYKAKEKLMEYQAKVQGARQPLVLINSVPTRWNSTYFMIERFVHLQDAVMATVPILDVDLPIITGEEWTALRQLCKVLKQFDEATKELSAEKYVCASKAIAVISALNDVMEELKRKPADFDAIKNIVQCIETQLKSRLGDLEHEQSLALCTTLDPRYKISMFIDESAAERAKSNLVTKVYNLMTDETTAY
ncbi:unnamed protein product [Parnassius apollo]|uniref:(apollo) hypothetical protein n=1 Tax=Parnassius apollo TaxID=110799 RepID=A0A8S3X4C7_PARAO|nr:unnamed protein product [Parnassius apollo]